MTSCILPSGESPCGGPEEEARAFIPLLYTKPVPHLKILLLEFTTRMQQQKMMNRQSEFYEGKYAAGRYTSIIIDRKHPHPFPGRILGYNIPVSSIDRWLRYVYPAQPVWMEDRGWTCREECEEEEVWLLELLTKLGWLDKKLPEDIACDHEHEWGPECSDAERIFKHHEALNELRAISPGPYIISYVSNMPSVKIHELQHAFFHHSPKLRAFSQEVFDNLNSKDKDAILAGLTETRTYVDPVMMDAFQAYAVETWKGEIVSGFGRKEGFEEVMRNAGKTTDEFCQAHGLKEAADAVTNELVESMESLKIK